MIIHNNFQLYVSPILDKKGLKMKKINMATGGGGKQRPPAEQKAVQPKRKSK